jgi:hypothetical protein
MTMTEVVAVTGLAMNAAVIIWGAAKLSSAVENLKDTVREIKGIMMVTQEIVHNMVGRMWVVEDRLDIPHRRISDNPPSTSKG